MRIFRSQGKKFYFKAVFIPVLIDKLLPCDRCNGNGKEPPFSRFGAMDENDQLCSKCYGRCHEYWIDPEPKEDTKKLLELAGEEIISKMEL